MNTLKGNIESIVTKGSLSLVKVKVDAIALTTIVIETPETSNYLKVGKSINAIFKETEVAIGKGNCDNISLQNKLDGSISSIEKGEILSKIIINTPVGSITSIITTNAVNQLKLEVGEMVTAMIKTNEIMFSE